MNTLHKQCGYDAVFTSETPEYIQCTVCQLVLRNPVQIIKCGHKFCSPCFTGLKEYSVQMGSELRCPVDRELIDLEKVCEDHGLRRAVSNLSVKCDRYEQGCLWRGELSELEHHEQHCEFHPQDKTSPSAIELNDLLATVNRLRERMDGYEQELEKKEKENTHMKHSLLELKEQYMKESKAMAKKVAKMDIELFSVKEINAAFEKEINLLKERNEGLEKEVEDLMQKYKMIIKEQTKLENEIKPEEEEPIVVEAEQVLKRVITLSRFGCLPHQVFIDPENRCIDFKCGQYLTVVGHGGGIPKGEKAFFEVTVLEQNWGSNQFGWVNYYFLASGLPRNLGSCCNSYGYNPTAMLLKHKDAPIPYGPPPKGNGIGVVIGVAIDMVRGEIMYGIDGDWDLGVAFKSIDTSNEYYPAVGCIGTSTVSVNFGEKELKYGPPDASFKNVVDVKL